MTIPYILIAIIVLGIIWIALFFFMKNRVKRPLSVLSALSFVLVIIGIISGGDNRVFAYSLIGLGVILSVVDIFVKSKE